MPILGAANILRKHLSKQNESIFGLSRGCLAQPLRVKILQRISRYIRS
jgi:hypothetical protein